MAVTLLLAGCGGGDGSARESAEGAGPGIGGTPIRVATCTDWQKADASQRLTVVRQLKNILGGPVGSSALKRGRTLDDRRAYEYFQETCPKAHARGFKLYKLYARAAAFQDY